MSARTESSAWHQRSARRFPGVSLALFLAAVLVFLWPRLTILFQYDRAAVLTGEVWRVLTCQWTHWNRSHLVWDALMFLALGVLCERVCRARFLTCVTVSVVVIPVAAAVAVPQMYYYRGLSGLDSALFVLLFVQLIRMNRRRDRAVVAAAAIGLVAFALKTAFECATGRIIFVQPESAFAPVPLAHVVGGAVGFLIGACGAGSATRPVAEGGVEVWHESPSAPLAGDRCRVSPHVGSRPKPEELIASVLQRTDSEVAASSAHGADCGTQLWQPRWVDLKRQLRAIKGQVPTAVIDPTIRVSDVERQRCP